MRTNPLTSRRHRAAVAVAVAVGALAVSVTGARPASACSCTAPPPPETAAAEADAVFVGEVTDVDERARTTHIARLDVTEVLAGEVEADVEVHTPPDSAACGYAFEVGRVELVYAVLDDQGRLQTNLCDRTAPVADADEDLAALGEGAPPAATAPDEGQGWLLPSAGALVLAASAIVAVSLRRRPRRERP